MGNMDIFDNIEQDKLKNLYNDLLNAFKQRKIVKIVLKNILIKQGGSELGIIEENYYILNVNSIVENGVLFSCLDMTTLAGNSVITKYALYSRYDDGVGYTIDLISYFYS